MNEDEPGSDNPLSQAMAQAEQASKKPGGVNRLLGQSFYAPVALWMFLAALGGVAAGYIAMQWPLPIRTYLIAAGLAMILAFVSLFDRQLIIKRFPGGVELWREIPRRPKFLFMVRQFVVRVTLTVPPALVAAFVTAYIYWYTNFGPLQ